MDINEEKIDKGSCEEIDQNGFYKTIFNNLYEGVLVFDKNGSLLHVNDAWLKIHYTTRPEAIRFSKYLPDHYCIRDVNLKEISYNAWPISRILKGEKLSDEKYLITVKEKNRDIYVSCSGQPIVDDNGNFIAGMLVIRDISEQMITKFKLDHEIEKKNEFYKQIEHYQQQLNNDKHLLQSIIDTIPVMIVIYDEKVKSIILNSAFQDITGWTIEDTKKSDLMELVYPDKEYRIEVYKFMRSLDTGFKDIIVRTKDGRDIETSWANVRIPDGR